MLGPAPKNSDKDKDPDEQQKSEVINLDSDEEEANIKDTSGASVEIAADGAVSQPKGTKTMLGTKTMWT